MKEFIKSILWFIFLLFIVPIVLEFLINYSREYIRKKNYSRRLEEAEDLITEDETETITVQRPNFDYAAIQINPQDIDLNSKFIIITYEMLSKQYLNPLFLNRFYQSVISVMNSKRCFYSKKYKVLVSRLQISDSDQPFDQVKSRIESEIKVIENVLKNLKTSAVKFSTSDIKKGLTYIFTDSQHGFPSVRGRTDFKDFLCRNLFSFVKNPLSFSNSAQNVLLLGGSGLGKTKLARLLGTVYSKTYVFLTDIFMEADTNVLVSEYVSSSGNNTKKVILSCLEGVCFIDEIYGLGSSNGIAGMFSQVNHGTEAVNALVGILEPLDGKIVVIGAGYKDRVENEFLSLNEGLARRFPHVFEITPYNAKELTDILLDFLYSPKNKLRLSESEIKIIYNIICKYNKETPRVFNKQAGDMKNISEEIIRCTHSIVSQNQSALLGIFQAFKVHLSRHNINFTEREIRSVSTI